MKIISLISLILLTITGYAQDVIKFKTLNKDEESINFALIDVNKSNQFVENEILNLDNASNIINHNYQISPILVSSTAKKPKKYNNTGLVLSSLFFLTSGTLNLVARNTINTKNIYDPNTSKTLSFIQKTSNYAFIGGSFFLFIGAVSF